MKRIVSLLLIILGVVFSVNAQKDSLVIYTNDNVVYKSLEAWKNRWHTKEIASEQYDLKKGKVAVYEEGKMVDSYAFTNGIGKVAFPVNPGKTYVVKITGQNCYPPITYEIKTEGYDREGTKVVGFGKRYKRSFGVDWNMFSAGYTFESPTAEERKEMDRDKSIAFTRYFKFARLAKRFRPDSLAVLITNKFEDAAEFHEQEMEERREERIERREERRSEEEEMTEEEELAAEKKIDSIRVTLDQRLKSMTNRMFRKEVLSAASNTTERKMMRELRDSVMEEVLMEEEAVSNLLNMKMKGKMMEDVDDEEIDYERKKIKDSRKNLMDQFSKAETSEDSLQLYLLIQQLDAAEKNLDNLSNELKNHKEQAMLQKELAEKRKESLKAAKDRNQILYIGLALISVVLIAALYFLVLSRRLNKKVNEQVVQLKDSNEEIQAQRDQIESQKKLVEKKNEQITSSITYAERIQGAILNKHKKWQLKLPEHFVFFKPKDIVSGDFYWTYVKGEYLYLAVADCTGHGVPGALLTMLGSSHLNEISVATGDILEPAEMLNQLRVKILEDFSESETGSEGRNKMQVKDGMDISLIRYHSKTRSLSWAGANNPLYYARKAREGEEEIAINGYAMEIVKPDKEPIGATRNPTPFTNHTLQLEAGDGLYLFSDGYADQFGGPNNKKYGYKRFRKELLKLHAEGTSCEEQGDLLKQAFQFWLDEGKDDQIDDVCVAGIKIG